MTGLFMVFTDKEERERERRRTASFLHRAPTVDPPCRSRIPVVAVSVVLFDETVN